MLCFAAVPTANQVLCVRCCCCCCFIGYFRSLQVNIIIPSLCWISNVGRWVSINFLMEFFFFVISPKCILYTTQFRFYWNLQRHFYELLDFLFFAVVIISIPLCLHSVRTSVTFCYQLSSWWAFFSVTHFIVFHFFVCSYSIFHSNW